MNSRALVPVVVTTCVLAAAGALAAQAPEPEFDVASVKPALPDRSLHELVEASRRQPPGQWRSLDLTLHNLILNAYPEFRMPGMLIGVPGWSKDARFDIQARMPRDTTQANVQKMLRHLLRSRFGLQTHTERRTLDVFVMTLAQPGKPGPGLTPAATPCVLWHMTRGPAPAQCDLFRAGAPGGLTMSVATLADLITAVTITAITPGRTSSAIDRPIVDRTGLDGYFQIVGPSPMAGDGASFFTLFEEQLGLKLTRGREPVDVLVIDAVSMPEPD